MSFVRPPGIASTQLLGGEHKDLSDRDGGPGLLPFTECAASSEHSDRSTYVFSEHTGPIDFWGFDEQAEHRSERTASGEHAG